MVFWDVIYVLFGLLIAGLVIHNLRKPLKPKEKTTDNLVLSPVESESHWVCAYCKTRNGLGNDKCFNCGAPRT